MQADVAFVVLGLGAALLAVGLVMQMRTHRLRRRWRSVGLGIEERSTGLASLSAIPVIFPGELETARMTDTQVAVLTMRRMTVAPEELGTRLASVLRAHEVGWRIDFDVFAVTLLVRSKDEAVLAAARIGRELCEGTPTSELRAGIALCPDDGDELLDVVDVCLRRMRSIEVVDAIAAQVWQERAARITDADDDLAAAPQSA